MSTEDDDLDFLQQMQQEKAQRDAQADATQAETTQAMKHINK